jgi:hypothetical protein
MVTQFHSGFQIILKILIKFLTKVKKYLLHSALMRSCSSRVRGIRCLEVLACGLSCSASETFLRPAVACLKVLRRRAATDIRFELHFPCLYWLNKQNILV